jgi:hypothetical protein
VVEEGEAGVRSTGQVCRDVAWIEHRRVDRVVEEGAHPGREAADADVHQSPGDRRHRQGRRLVTVVGDHLAGGISMDRPTRLGGLPEVLVVRQPVEAGA